MAQNITLLGANYADVPAVELPKTSGGTATFTDVTDTTAEAADVASGKVFFDALGQKLTGTASGGGGSNYNLIFSTEVTYATTSTSAATVGTYTITGYKVTADNMYYVCIRDKAGVRDGYFVGTDSIASSHNAANGTTANVTLFPKLIYSFNSNAWMMYAANGTTGYGLYPARLQTSSSGNTTLSISARYQATQSKIIDGTYIIELYELTWPDGRNPLKR